jgi:large subunit ribosomal protein L7/L12
MAKLSSDQLIEAFKELTLIELSEFVKKFEEVFEVTAAAPVAVAAVGGAAAAVEEVEEKDSFDVVLESAGEKKIQVIKEVRALTSLGLGEAKAVVDGAPGVVLEGVNKETAEKAKAPPSHSSSRSPARGFSGHRLLAEAVPFSVPALANGRRCGA